MGRINRERKGETGRRRESDPRRGRKAGREKGRQGGERSHYQRAAYAVMAAIGKNGISIYLMQIHNLCQSLVLLQATFVSHIRIIGKGRL